MSITDIMKLAYAAMTGVGQDHPRHDSDLLGHTQRVTLFLLESGRPDLEVVGILHDVGKVTTRARHKTRPHDVFYGHPKASIKFIDDHNIEVNNHHQWLIHHHDDLMNVKDVESFYGYIVKHGETLARDILDVNRADLAGQRQDNADVISDIELNEKFRRYMMMGAL